MKSPSEKEREKREALLTVYKNLHYENWQRGHGIWVINSILITGSVIVAFQSTMKDFPTPIVSLALVITALIMHATTEQVTRITYKKMEKIGEDLGITEPQDMYKIEIRGKLWYRIRVNQAYFLFVILICIYSFLLLPKTFVLMTVLGTGFLTILAAEIYRYLKRDILDSLKREVKAEKEASV